MTCDGKSTSGDRSRHRAPPQRRTWPGNAMRAVRFGMGRGGNYERRMLPTATWGAVTRQLEVPSAPGDLVRVPIQQPPRFGGTGTTPARDQIVICDRRKVTVGPRLRQTPHLRRSVACARCRNRRDERSETNVPSGRATDPAGDERHADAQTAAGVAPLSRLWLVVLPAASGRGTAVDEHCPQDQWNL